MPMEDAAVHAVDGLAGTPELIFVLGILLIIAIVLIKVVPMWRDYKQKQLENEAKFKSAQIDIERDRELRKMEEAKQRRERDKENTAIMTRAVAAQERSNVVMAESTAQLSILNAKLDASQDRSRTMFEKVDDMSTEVHDIHTVIVSK